MKPTRLVLLTLGAACALPAPAAHADAAATLVAEPGALRGELATVSGAVAPSDAGRRVEVQRLDARRGWVRAAGARTAPDGTFVARWRPPTLGTVDLRLAVRMAGSRVRIATTQPTVRTTVFRPVRATWYGPGLFGQQTACGQVLDHRIMGVAHRTLPCGTPVQISIGATTVTVPVIDRGPFANGARYDLTYAAAQAIGMTSTTTLGVLPQRGGLMDPPFAPPDPGAEQGGVAYDDAAAPQPAPAPAPAP